MYVHIYLCIYVCMHACMYAWMHLYVYIYIPIYIYIYVHWFSIWWLHVHCTPWPSTASQKKWNGFGLWPFCFGERPTRMPNKAERARGQKHTDVVWNGTVSHVHDVHIYIQVIGHMGPEPSFPSDRSLLRVQIPQKNSECIEQQSWCYRQALLQLDPNYQNQSLRNRSEIWIWPVPGNSLFNVDTQKLRAPLGELNDFAWPAPPPLVGWAAAPVLESASNNSEKILEIGWKWLEDLPWRTLRNCSHKHDAKSQNIMAMYINWHIFRGTWRVSMCLNTPWLIKLCLVGVFRSTELFYLKKKLCVDWNICIIFTLVNISV